MTRARTLAAAAGLAVALAVAPAGADTEPARGAAGALDSLAAPSPWMLAQRAAAATAVVAGGIAGIVVLHRAAQRGGGRRGWLARWLPASTAPADRIEVLAKHHFGGRESLSVVRVGRERFLVGVTPGSISLVSRLDTAAAAGRAVAEAPVRAATRAATPAAAAAPAVAATPRAPVTEPEPFGAVLETVLAPEARPEALLRASIARSRDRLDRGRSASA